MMRFAWTTFVVATCLFLLMLICRSVIVIGIFFYMFLPTAGTVMVVLGVGAIASLAERRSLYYGAMGATLIVLTLAGLYLRQQAETSGKANVHQRASITRVVTAALREPVALASDDAVEYDAALYDAVDARCGDPHCFSISGLAQKGSPAAERPNGILEVMGLKPVPADAGARLAVRVTQADVGNRKAVHAEVIESGAVTANWDASLPARDRKVVDRLPAWVHYWLEENPLVAMLKPRPLGNERMLATFLRSAIQVPHAGSAPMVAIDAAPLYSRAIVPPLKVDRSDLTYAKWWVGLGDSRCDGVISVEERPQIADGYVTFLKNPELGPQLRVSSESLICAGDAVYVQRYGRTPSDVLDMARYSLSGEHTADLRIRVPTQAFNEFIAFDQRTVTERDGKLEFDVRSVRFQWARDATGKPTRNAQGETIEYAIISREGRYVAALPAGVTAEP
ncbi:MAG TPA: hypothetical protein VM687_10410 [Stenotrophomonas sp.]|nr:hypothetical protein [Stenotrophomonas sp.]